MADSGLVVTISGAALSFLFYENACSLSDQMGFLLGDVVVYVTKNVTDSERHEESVRRHIEITGVLTCPSSGSLHDSNGKLFNSVLKECIRDRSKEIVGWYRYRHNSRLVPTFRDKILHKQLAEYFHECNSDTPRDHFLSCMVNASTSETQATHKFRHVLLRYDNRFRVYHPVPLKINNLGRSADRPDANDYMPTPDRSHEHEPDVFTKLVKSLNLGLDHKSPSELVMTIQKASECYLDNLIPQLCKSDREVYELEKQVREMRSSIIRKEIIAEEFPPDNQQANESNRRVPVHMEAEHSLKIGIKQQSPPRTPNAYEDSCVFKDSSTVKIKTEVKPQNNVINTNARRNTSNSVLKSPISYSQAAKKSVESDEDMFSMPDC